MSDGSRTEITPDPRRWILLGLAIAAICIVVIDTTVLVIAIPTIIRDFDSELTSVQWAVTGYALVFASFLVIAGRLGDMFGTRRLLVLGCGVFATGSLVAVLAQNVPQLIVGLAVIEGIGAAMLTPATLAIVSRTFQGRERVTAFATWGAAVGGASALGPLVGGYLTTHHSWRWSFGINVIIAPIVIIGAMLLMPRDEQRDQRQRLDILGAVLSAIGTFALIFAITQSEAYGWWEPIRDFTVLGHRAWPGGAPVSVVPFAIVVSAVVLVSFVRLELRKERADDQPLFELSQFRNLEFRYGVILSFLLSIGQLGALFVIPVFLQSAKELTPLQNGLWVCPSGFTIIVTAQLGGRLARRLGSTTVLRIGLGFMAIGITAEGVVLRETVEFWQLAIALALYGIGNGFVTSQLSAVMLSGVPLHRLGAASAVNTTARQAGGAFGVATIGTVYALVSEHHGMEAAVRSGLAVGGLVVLASMAVAFFVPHVGRPGDEVDADRADPYSMLEPADAHLADGGAEARSRR